MNQILLNGFSFSWKYSSPAAAIFDRRGVKKPDCLHTIRIVSSISRHFPRLLSWIRSYGKQNSVPTAVAQTRWKMSDRSAPHGGIQLHSTISFREN